MAKSKLQIITLGAAVLDAFLIGQALVAKRDVRTHDEVEQFPLGAKVELDDALFTIGGGAANAATTFARQGFEVKIIAKIADDLAGREVLKSLKAEDVDTGGLVADLKESTGFSAILLAPNGERTILTHRGSSEDLTVSDLKKSRLKAEWLYISSLGGNWAVLEAAVTAAAKLGTKIAIDPGFKELAEPVRLKKLLAKVTLLKGNKQELGKLFNKDTTHGILKAAGRVCSFVVVTDAHKGAAATDGQKIYELGIYKDVKVIDRTGAGDAFGSGLVSELAKGKDLSRALAFGSANSTSVVQHIGGQTGILMESAQVAKMPIRTSSLE